MTDPPEQSSYIAVKRDQLRLLVLAAGGFVQEHEGADIIKPHIEEFASDLGMPAPPWVTPQA